MHKVVIFGLSDSSELAHFYLTHDSTYNVVAFTVSEEYIPESKMYNGLPVIPFEKLNSSHPPEAYKLFAPLFCSKMNRFREEIYNAGKARGYEFISYISSKATVFGTEIGENCFILEDNTIQPFTTIGNNCVLWSGNHIGHHGQIKDHAHMME